MSCSNLMFHGSYSLTQQESLDSGTILQAFSDTVNGWAIYNGELRHNSNSSGPKYGTAIQAGDVIGVMLDMQEVKFRIRFMIIGYSELQQERP